MKNNRSMCVRLIRLSVKKEFEFIYKYIFGKGEFVSEIRSEVKSNKESITKVSRVLKLSQLQSESDLDDLEAEYIERVLLEVTGYLSYLQSKRDDLTKKLIYSKNHLYLRGNLFVTCLLLYGFLEDEKNERMIIELIDNEESRFKVVNIIQQERDSCFGGRESFHFGVPIPYGVKLRSVPSLEDGGLSRSVLTTGPSHGVPKYNSLKKLSGFRTELRRTLLERDFIKFKNKKDLSYVSILLAKGKKKLLQDLCQVRYIDRWLSEKEVIFSLELTSSKKELRVMGHNLKNKEVKLIKSINLD